MWQNRKTEGISEARRKIREIQSMRKIIFSVAGFEDRKRGPWATEYRQPLGAEMPEGHGDLYATTQI